MGKNKKKNNDDKKTEKVILTVFGLAFFGLGTYYISERMRIAKENKNAINSTSANTGGSGVLGNPITSQNVICKGDKNEKVRILQNYLKYVKGRFIGNAGVDGDWGTNTQKAVVITYGESKNCFTKAEIDMMIDAYKLAGF